MAFALPEVLPMVTVPVPVVPPSALLLVLACTVPALMVSPPVKVFTPESSSVPPAAFMVTEPAPPTISETVLDPLEYVSAVSPVVRLTELPPMAYPLAETAIEAKLVPAVKLLFGEGRVPTPVESKIRLSPATGAVPPQLPDVVQLLSAPPPVQVRVAA